MLMVIMVLFFKCKNRICELTLLGFTDPRVCQSMWMLYDMIIQLSFQQVDVFIDPLCSFRSPREAERDSGLDQDSSALGRSRAGSELSVCSNSSARAMQDFLAYGIGPIGGGWFETPVYIHTEISTSISLSLYLYIYISLSLYIIYIYIYLSIYLYLYLYLLSI